MKKRVLFVCIHNGGRSQMAQAFVNAYGRGKWEAHSAGITPGSMNPVVIEAMKELGFDMAGHHAKSVDAYRDGKVTFDHVITVCDEGNAAKCPVFPGQGKKHHWPFEDPAAITGQDKLAQTRVIRDKIKARVMQWLGEDHV